MNPLEKVPVVIINYKTSHLIQKLVQGIREDLIDLRIIILDNGSTQETFSALKEIKDTRVSLIQSVDNLGFTGGMNFVLQHIYKNFGGIKYVFLLNPDAVISANTIGGLVQKLKTYPNAACISPQIVTTAGDPTFSGSHINFKRGVVSTVLKNQSNTTENVYEVDAFTGCAVLMDLQKIIQAGLFNEKLFMYFDEADLSIRIKKSGYTILYTPAFKVAHDTSYTTKDISFVKTYFMTRNKFILFGKTMTFFHKVYFLLHELAYHHKNKRYKNAYYHLKGFAHFTQGKSGNQFQNI